MRKILIVEDDLNIQTLENAITLATSSLGENGLTI